MTMKKIPIRELPSSMRASLEVAAEELQAEGVRLEKKYGQPTYLFAVLANRLAALAGIVAQTGNEGIADLIADVGKDFAPLMVLVGVDPAKTSACLKEIDAASMRQSESIFAAQDALEKMTQGANHV